MSSLFIKYPFVDFCFLFITSYTDFLLTTLSLHHFVRLTISYFICSVTILIFSSVLIFSNLIEFISVDHTYPDFQLLMKSYQCTSDLKNFNLTEHIDFKWLEKVQLMDLDWAAADIPIVKALME